MDSINQNNKYVTIKLLFFAKAREIVGQKEILAKVPSETTGKNLLDHIVDKYNLKQLQTNVILALNQSWVDLNSKLVLEEKDELAVIPPLSGEAIYNKVCSPEFGAVSIFVGTTRNNFEGKTVTKLEYEAYEGMAIKSLENICLNIRQKFDVGNIAIYHRLGDVPIQEASVVIAISSKHRKPALEAVPYAIDALKADVPIWKKEIYEGSEGSEWKENSECTWSNEIIHPSQESNSIQLYEEVIEEDAANEVPPHLIQINANLQEINRRINSFIKRKREQINISNIQDFGLEKNQDPEFGTCARVSAVLIRQKDSKSHLKVRRVENTVGPQTHEVESASLSSLPESPVPLNCPSGAEERLTNVERYLNVHQSSKDVFSRLKAIEDKILFLESISPEYFDFSKQKEGNFPLKRTYSFSELDLKMQRLEAKLQKKTNIT